MILGNNSHLQQNCHPDRRNHGPAAAQGYENGLKGTALRPSIAITITAATEERHFDKGLLLMRLCTLG